MEKRKAIVVGAQYELWRDTIRYFQGKDCDFIVFGWRSDKDKWKEDGVLFYEIEQMWELSMPTSNLRSSFLEWRHNNADKFIELIAMMDRLESNLYRFPHQLKESIVYSCLSWFDTLLDDHNISHVFMTNIPHRVWDNCLYHVSKHRDVKTTIFALSQFGSNVMVYDDIYSGPLQHDGRYCTNTSIIGQTIREWEEVSDYLPRDMVIQKQQNKSFLMFTIRKYLGKVKRFNFGRIKELSHPNTYRNLVSRSLTSSKPTWLRFFGDSVLKYQRIKRLKRSYVRVSTVELPDTYVYYPLHYQPEETTLPSGYGYYNQLELIRYVYSELPDDLWLVIKEHPSQFYHSNEGDMGRYYGFYDDIKSIGDRIILASMDLRSLDLLKRSAGIITVNGTVGIEALYAGKKVLTFGRVWYSSITGVDHISSTRLIDFFESLESSKRSDTADDVNWMKYLVSVKVYKEHQGLSDISLQESTLNLISYIQNVVLT